MSYQIHQLAGVTGSQMMFYVITSSDGGVFLIDGGYDKDADYLVDYVKKVSGGNHIDAWFLTHPHCDHISAFCNIMENMPDALEIERVCYNCPPADFVEQWQYDQTECETVKRFNAVEPKFADRAIILHDGDSLEYAGLAFDVLYEPDMKVTANVVNNAGLLLKFYLDKKTLLITGDLGIEGGRAALAKYGQAKLKSDIVEMAHHGQNGVERSFYEAVQPSCCLWPTPLWLWDNDAGGGYDSYGWKTIVVRGWMSELGVRKHLVAKDGDLILDI